jgi:hypothetical protein
MRYRLLVDDRFCHPDACKAQIPLDNVPSRHKEKFVPTERERDRERDFVFQKCPAVCLQMTDSANHLLGEHRFCHPDACRAQILHYNESSSRYMEKFVQREREREREREEKMKMGFCDWKKSFKISQNQKGFSFLVELTCMQAFEILGGMLSFNCVY